MQKGRKAGDWLVCEQGFDKSKIEAAGSKFFIGNGYLGYRGTLEEYGKAELVACTLSGIYDRRGQAWREPVNAPNGLLLRLVYQGKALSALSGKVLQHEQILDFKQGLHMRRTLFALGAGNNLEVISERFASQQDPHLLCLRTRLRAAKACQIKVQSGIDGDVWDIHGPHFAGLRLDASSGLLRALGRTNEGKEVAVVEACAGDLGQGSLRRESKSIVREFSLKLEAGWEYQLEKFVGVYTSLDPVADPLKAATQASLRAKDMGYNAARQASAQVWDTRWADSDVQIEGDSLGQHALRYSIYQLLSIAPQHSDKVSIPARGLSGQVYKGAIFWDTEMFMLPFFLHCQPGLARNLVKYRFYGLQGARKKARQQGYRGAFYAWESQEGGEEACTLFNITDVFTNRPMRTYFADKQIHISADVAHGIWQYYRLTGDESLLLDGGAEVILECARFFLSWAYFKKDKGRFELLDVTGPDEYHERVHNEAYSSAMARQVASMALEMDRLLRLRHASAYKALLRKLAFEKDLADLKDFYQRLYVPQPDAKSGVIEQFDGYFKLEDVSLKDLKARMLNPHEYLGGGQGLATTTQIIKQADVMMLLNVLGSQYSAAVKKANWEFYEPRTEHGSSLSACVYALVAAAIGKVEWAYRYFLKTATVDLSGDSKQYVGTLYIGGTHPAANGGAWMAAVLGFGGLSADGPRMRLQPHLPKKWKSLSFRVAWQGQRLSVRIQPRAIEVHADASNTRPCPLDLNGKQLSCAPGALVRVKH